MARCNFCRRTFGNAQAVRAHLRFCSAYQGRGTGIEHVAEGSVEDSLPKARLPRSGVPIERHVPDGDPVDDDPLARLIRQMERHLETKLRFQSIDAIQRKLDEPNLDPLEELRLLDRFRQELKRLR